MADPGVSLRLSYLMQVREDMSPNWQDSIPSISYTISLIVTDSLNFWSDSVPMFTGNTTIGLALSDSLNFWIEPVPKVMAAHLLQIADGINFWADNFARSSGNTVLGVALADSINFWND